MAATHDEGSKGGSRSVLIWAVVSAILMVWVVVTMYSGRKHVAPATGQPQTEAPAPAGSPSP